MATNHPSLRSRTTVDVDPTFSVTKINPSTGGQAGAVELTTADGFAAAAGAAKAAQSEWASVPAPIRGRAIAALGRLVEANFEALAQVVTTEIGKPIAEARGEVQEVIDTCDFFAAEGRRLYGQTVPSEMSSKSLFTRRRPVGTMAVITAGNFPVAVPSWYIVPALLAGNTTVWKPAEYAAASADALWQLIRAAGIPEAACQLVHADGPATFAGLDASLHAGSIDKVGFTGSSAVGQEIGGLCGRHLQTPCLELGGKNPLLVWSDADLDLAVEGALFSGFGTAGQRCTSLGTVIAHEAVADEFLARFNQAVSTAVVGDPTREDVLFGPLMSERFAASFEQHLALIEDHHQVLGSTGTGRISVDNPRPGFVGDAGGIYYHPTIAAGVRIDDAIANTETFGPLVGVATAADFDEAMSFANGHGYGLSASIYTSTPAIAFRFQDEISSGMVSINNSTSGAEAHLPFGGNARSGNGSRQSGVWVLDQVTRWQSVNWDWSGRLQKAQMDTATISPEADFRL
ncbi:MAG: aldehyde dehydrogenase family protein [Acidimicrobiales bacterium]